MSNIDNILNKLAEKRVLEGDMEMACRLIEAATKKCTFCDTEGELVKKGGKNVCAKCGRDTVCAKAGCGVKKLYGEMIKKGEKAYCCEACAGTKKKKASTLESLIQKYAMQEDEIEEEEKDESKGEEDSDEKKKSDPADEEDDKEKKWWEKLKDKREGKSASVKEAGEFDDKRREQNRKKWEGQTERWDKWKSENPDYVARKKEEKYQKEKAKLKAKYGPKTSAVLSEMLNKYAQGFEHHHGDGDFLPDDIMDAQGEGYDSGQDAPDVSNPYDPASDLGRAWSQGWQAALSEKSADFPDVGF